MLTPRLLARRCWFNVNRYCSSKVPSEPTWIQLDTKKIPQVPEISRELVDQLERLSLVEFGGEEGLACLTAAVKSANGLYMVNTDRIEPLDSVLEDRVLYLRQDAVTEGKCRSAVLSNAVRSEEEYFVAPPGNIPLKSKDTDYKDKLS